MGGGGAGGGGFRKGVLGGFLGWFLWGFEGVVGWLRMVLVKFSGFWGASGDPKTAGSQLLSEPYGAGVSDLARP